jgi:hypothetical protein
MQRVHCRYFRATRGPCDLVQEIDVLNNAGSIAVAGCLWLCALQAAAMTPERKKQIADLTADADAMWKALPALASDAGTTAALMQDFEAFAQLPARPGSGLPETRLRNAMEGAAWLKKILPKQYVDETRNLKLKDAATPAPGAHPLPIPKVIHFIWLGSPVPEKYLANIDAISTLNPDYRTQVWLDDQSRASASRIKGSRCRARHVDEVLGHAVASEDARNIYRLTVSTSGSRPNYAAASDVLRLLVLLAEGGVYLDTDTYIENPGTACGFGQLKAKYGFLVSTRTQFRDGPFNNSPMAAVPGSPVLRELLALAEKRYRDAGHAAQPAYGRGPESQPWLYWVASGSRDDLRLASTVFLCGPVLVWDYFSRLGHGWLQARNIELDARVQPGPPAVEWFAEQARRVDYACPGAIAPVENYFFISNVYGDFDLTSETFGLSHRFDQSWLAPKTAPVEAKASGQS